MTKFIIKKFLSKTNNPRIKSGTISGIIGIICNILLCIVKFIAGFVTSSVAITADAINNLTDAITNVVTVFSSKISSKPNDAEHPFGHGRMEYISAMFVSFFIMLMGFETAKNSVSKLFNPHKIEYSAVTIILLIIAILLKLWMSYFNYRMYNVYKNLNLKTVSKDCLCDCFSTFSTVIALIITHHTRFNYADSIIGIIVSAVIIITGIQSLKDVITRLLGKAPDKSKIDEIESIICENDLISGVHDIFVHDYGADKIIASAHAEVPNDCDIVTIHNIIDTAEKKIKEKLNIIICIHIDPVETKNRQSIE